MVHMSTKHLIQPCIWSCKTLEAKAAEVEEMRLVEGMGTRHQGKLEEQEVGRLEMLVEVVFVCRRQKRSLLHKQQLGVVEKTSQR